MFCRHKLLILIPAIILIPILLGMTPLTIAHKFSSGGPLTHGKQVRLSNHCLFHSVTSHNDLTVKTLNSTALDQELLLAQEIDAPVLDSFSSYTFFNSVPLRC
jgi:hypothetical protein